MSDEAQGDEVTRLNPTGRTAQVSSLMTQRWRLPEFVVLTVAFVAIMTVEGSYSGYQQYIPEVFTLDYLELNSCTFQGNTDGIYGYPVRLGKEWCTAEDIELCADRSSFAQFSGEDHALDMPLRSRCCAEVETGTLPGETVSSAALLAVSLGLPLVLIFARLCLMKYAFLGLVFALGFTIVLTDAVKLLVGRPRPNYAALQALAGFNAENASDLKRDSIESFPSGHSSWSMTGAAFATLLFWRDASKTHVPYWVQWWRMLIGYLLLWPTMVALWVGVTRVRDYWHFQDDVLAGWSIGIVSAAIAWYWVSSPQDWEGDEVDLAARVMDHPA